MQFSQFIRTKLFWKHLIMSVVSVLLFILLSVFAFNIYTQHNQYTTVPNFKGIYINDIAKSIDNKDISFMIIDSVYSEEVPKGTVVDQNPSSGSTVKRGRTVYLTVNALLMQQVLMPNLINLSLRQASSLLETFGLRIGNLTYVEGLPPVMEQRYNGKIIAPNTPIFKGSSIDLVLGRDKKGLRIPELIGMSILDAKKMLDQRNLIMQIVDADSLIVDSSAAIIKNQEPGWDANHIIEEGDIISVWLDTDYQSTQSKVHPDDSKHKFP